MPLGTHSASTRAKKSCTCPEEVGSVASARSYAYLSLAAAFFLVARLFVAGVGVGCAMHLPQIVWAQATQQPATRHTEGFANRPTEPQ